MIEWSALILLVPLILVPLVLLFGFSGCHLVFGVDPVGKGPFQTLFQTPSPLVDELSVRNRCIVLRLEPEVLAALTTSVSDVKITIRRPPSGVLHLLNLFISQAANFSDSNRDPHDSATDQTPVLSGDMYLVPDPNSPTVELPEVSYALDNTQPLLIAFDVGAEGALPSTADPIPDFLATTYIGPAPPAPDQPVHEAAILDRQSDYIPRPRIVLVESIAVR